MIATVGVYNPYREPLSKISGQAIQNGRPEPPTEERIQAGAVRSLLWPRLGAATPDGHRGVN